VKTISLKKVAVVAVASLGFGLLSVVPANAAAIASANMALTGTAGTNNNIVVAGTAATVINTTTGGAGVAFKVTDPSGTISYVGQSFANAAVGAVTGTATGTLTFATTFLAQTGKYTVSSAADGTAADLDTLAKVTAATAAATIVTSVFFVTKATPSFSGGSGRTVTSATAISQDVNGVATVNIVADNASSSYVVTSSGVGSMTSAFATDAGFTAQNLTATANDVVVNNNGTNAAGGVTWTPAATTGKSFIQVKATGAVAGDQKISVTPLNASGTPGTPVTATITWGATPAFSTGTTTSIRNATTATNATSDATILVSKSLATQAANIIVTVKDAAGNALNGQTISASVTGPGLIGASATATAGNGTARVASVALSASQNVASIHVWADGTSGVGTVTILVGSAVAATETVNFFDSPATVTAVQNHKVLSSSGGAAGITPAANAGSGADIANTPAVILTVLDKNGLNVTGLTTTNISAVSSDATVMSSTITLAQSDATGAANPVSNNYNVQVSSVAKASGSTATLTFRVALGTTPETYVTATPLTYTLGGAPQTVILGLDRTSYTPGQAASVTLALRDSSGNPARDGDHTAVLAGALSSNLGIQGTVAFNATTTTVSSLGGVATVKVNAPATGGTWTVSGTTGSSTSNLTTTERAKAISVSATVVSENAGLLTQIDALNAKIVALNALIAKIMKKLGVK
jgi:hypothetical protein